MNPPTAHGGYIGATFSAAAIVTLMAATVASSPALGSLLLRTTALLATGFCYIYVLTTTNHPLPVAVSGCVWLVGACAAVFVETWSAPHSPPPYAVAVSSLVTTVWLIPASWKELPPFARVTLTAGGATTWLAFTLIGAATSAVGLTLSAVTLAATAAAWAYTLKTPPVTGGQ